MAAIKRIGREFIQLNGRRQTATGTGMESNRSGLAPPAEKAPHKASGPSRQRQRRRKLAAKTAAKPHTGKEQRQPVDEDLRNLRKMLFGNNSVTATESRAPAIDAGVEWELLRGKSGFARAAHGQEGKAKTAARPWPDSPAAIGRRLLGLDPPGLPRAATHGHGAESKVIESEDLRKAALSLHDAGLTPFDGLA